MGIFNTLFDSNPNKQIIKGQKVLEQIWQDYRDTIPRKIKIIEQFTGADDAQKLLALLNNGLIDVDRDEKLSDDLLADMHLRVHSRNMRTPQYFLGTMYDTDSIHEYIRGVLAQLHVVLATQLRLVKEFLNSETDQNSFVEQFKNQLLLERNIVRNIRIYFRSFNKLFSELLDGSYKIEIPTEEEEQEYAKLKSGLYGILSSKDTIIQPNVIAEPQRGPSRNIILMSQLETDVDAVQQYIRQHHEELIDRGYEDEEFTHERYDFWELRIINRPQFQDEVRKVLQAHHHLKLPPPYVKAFVRVFREWANDSAAYHRTMKVE